MNENGRVLMTPATFSVEPLAVSVGDAARMLGISRAALYPIVMAKAIDSFTVGTRRLVPMSALRRFVEEQAAAGKGGAA